MTKQKHNLKLDTGSFMLDSLLFSICYFRRAPSPHLPGGGSPTRRQQHNFTEGLMSQLKAELSTDNLTS